MKISSAIRYVCLSSIGFVSGLQPISTRSYQIGVSSPSFQNSGTIETSIINRRRFRSTYIGRISSNKDDYDSGEVGKGPNWIEKSFPVGTNEKIDPKKVDDYNLGISGKSFQTGPLGKRMYEAITSRTSLMMSDEIKQAFKLYAMDFTAKEATRAALSQNGLELVLLEEEEDQGMWGDVEAIRLYDKETGIAFSKLYDTFEEAVKDWTPGQQFDFVARQVPAKMRELTVDEIVQALDPDGSLRREAKQDKGLKNEEDVEEALLSIYDGNEVSSLSDLANDCVVRTENAPREATTEANAYAGEDTRGYQAINRSDLLTGPDGEISRKTLMHVMNALVSHGVLLVDLTDGGKNYDDAEKFADLWKATEDFFAKAEDDDVVKKLPGMTTVMETGSQHAKVGYASYENGSLRFLETRVERKSRNLLPVEARDILGDDGMSTMLSIFDTVTGIAKDIIRISTAASSVEHGAFIENEDDEESVKLKRALQASTLMAKELVDDGKSLGATTQIDHKEGSVSMSPHRLCRYAWEDENSKAEGDAREIFGSHTDSTFITAVPVAAVCGLEVFDEESKKWYRPELKARAIWEAEQRSKGKDPSSLIEDLDNGAQIPWHARFVAFMPGEHLQLVTRNEISAAVHRVVATKKGPPRFSSPILVRGRPGVRFLADRYVGGTLGDPLMKECDNMTLEDIYDATQPSSFQ